MGQPIKKGTSAYRGSPFFDDNSRWKERKIKASNQTSRHRKMDRVMGQVTLSVLIFMYRPYFIDRPDRPDRLEWAQSTHFYVSSIVY